MRINPLASGNDCQNQNKIKMTMSYSVLLAFWNCMKLRTVVKKPGSDAALA